jgi:hypothetical protein
MSVLPEKLSILAAAVEFPKPEAVVNLPHVLVAFNWLAIVDVHPVGGKVAASNPCVKGRAAPAGTAVTVKELVFELLALFKSVPPLGAEVNAT